MKCVVCSNTIVASWGRDYGERNRNSPPGWMIRNICDPCEDAGWIEEVGGRRILNRETREMRLVDQRTDREGE